MNGKEEKSGAADPAGKLCKTCGETWSEAGYDVHSGSGHRTLIKGTICAKEEKESVVTPRLESEHLDRWSCHLLSQ